MKTVAIICEYNPFHSGHLCQLRCIREQFGENTRIVAIMSGNFTQRGDVAFLDKSARAKMALACGANLVLELPFPYSMGSAEIFCEAGVRIADALGCVDLLSFGSECGDLTVLVSAAKIASSDAFKARIDALEKEHPALGYAALCEMALAEALGAEKAKALLSPNNILALEYIKALLRAKSSILPHTVRREGASYRAETLETDAHASAGAIRAAILDGRCDEALSFIPAPAREILCGELAAGLAPCDGKRLDSAVLSYFRLNKPTGSCHFQDAEGGLYNRLITKSYEATDIIGLTALAETKKFTRARIRRAIWYSFFGVTSSDARDPIGFTRVLALDRSGQAILREAKNKAAIAIVTKPSDPLADKTAQAQKALADRADAVFQLTKPQCPSGSTALRTSPYYGE